MIETEAARSYSKTRVKKAGVWLLGNAKDGANVEQTYVVMPKVVGLFEKDDATPVLPKGGVEAKGDITSDQLKLEAMRECSEEVGVDFNALLDGHSGRELKEFCTLVYPCKTGGFNKLTMYVFNVDNIRELQPNCKSHEYRNGCGSHKSPVDIARENSILPSQEELINILRTGRLADDYSKAEDERSYTNILHMDLESPPLLPTLERIAGETLDTPDKIMEALRKNPQLRVPLYKQARIIEGAMKKAELISDDKGVKIATEGRLMAYTLEVAEVVPLEEALKEMTEALHKYPEYKSKMATYFAQGKEGTRLEMDAQIDAMTLFSKVDAIELCMEIKPLDRIKAAARTLYESIRSRGREGERAA